MSFEFVTQADFVNLEHRVMDDPGLISRHGEIFEEGDEVERSGYRTTEQQVAELLFAGEKLKAFREAKYTFGDGVDDGYDPPDITDMVDAQRLSEVIKARGEAKLAKVRADAEAAAKAEAEQNAKDMADLKAFRESQQSQDKEV